MAKKKSTADTPVSPRAPRKRVTVQAAPKSANGGAHPNPTYNEIAEAAYHRYLKRQGSHGSDFDDWLEAERELRSRPMSNPRSQ